MTGWHSATPPPCPSCLCLLLFTLCVSSFLSAKKRRVNFSWNQCWFQLKFTLCFCLCTFVAFEHELILWKQHYYLSLLLLGVCIPLLYHDFYPTLPSLSQFLLLSAPLCLHSPIPPLTHVPSTQHTAHSCDQPHRCPCLSNTICCTLLVGFCYCHQLCNCSSEWDKSTVSWASALTG